ncbi:MAG: 4Fe-4S dicluster domain-containing protein [Myxococcota bacterium]
MSGPKVDRRTVIAGLIGFGSLTWALSPRAAHARLRPPGAAPPGRFEALCIRCYRCAEVCPVSCIQFEAGLDLRNLGTPSLAPKDKGCTLCMACTEACPTGALQPTSTDPERIFATVKMGEPILDRRRCISWSNQGVCRACYYVCPYPGKAITLGGPRQGPVFHAEACVGCALCSEACPPEAKAIDIRPPREG